MAKFIIGIVIGAAAAFVASKFQDEPIKPLKPYEPYDEPMTNFEFTSPSGTYRYRGKIISFEPSYMPPSSNPIGFRPL